MTYTSRSVRPGTTAIAALLAFSTSPLMAQTAPSAAPPVVTVPTPAPPVVATPAPAPISRTAPVAMEPVTLTPEQAEARGIVAPAAREAAPQRRALSAARSAPRPAPAVAAPASSANTAPIAEAPSPAVPFAEAPVAVPVAGPTVAPAQEAVADGDGMDMLPVAGGAAALLALAGGAYALSRRRRSGSDEGYAAGTWEQDHVAYAESAAPVEPEWREAEPAVTPAPMPATARTEQAEPLPAVAAAAPIAGADLSRYGRHVQAAYRGPTPDNPSLSLKRRLKRAAFFDQRERMAAEAAGAPQPMAAAEPSPAQPVAPRREATVTSRRVSPKGSTQALFGFRPAFQS